MHIVHIMHTSFIMHNSPSTGTIRVCNHHKHLVQCMLCMQDMHYMSSGHGLKHHNNTNSPQQQTHPTPQQTGSAVPSASLRNKAERPRRAEDLLRAAHTRMP